MGKTSNAFYAFDLNGKYLNTFETDGSLQIKSHPDAKLFLHKYIADKNNKIIGVALPEKNIVMNSNGEFIGRVFADGNVYDGNGIVVDHMYGYGLSFYAGTVGKALPFGKVVDFNGKNVGFINADGRVVTRFGEHLGQADAKGRWFDDKHQYAGGVVRSGAAIGYDGSYLGYVKADGSVIDKKGRDAG